MCNWDKTAEANAVLTEKYSSVMPKLWHFKFDNKFEQVTRPLEVFLLACRYVPTFIEV